MDKNFSLYLTKLGFFDENTAKEIIKSNKLLENKKFSDSSFHYLMNFFENLNEEQKKYMSYFIPNNYKIITNKLRTRKIKSILIQTILRQKLKLLKKLYQWKNNIKKMKIQIILILLIVIVIIAFIVQSKMIAI